MFEQLEQLLLSYGGILPLEVFAVLASFIEEVIAPIPSPAVMVVTGTLAALQERSPYALIHLSVLAALGKLAGALVVYFVADKAEDILTGRFGRFFGITHREIESFGKRVGKGARDYFVLTGLRALPIVPSSLVSIGSGVLKVRFMPFVVSTFLGTIVRDFVYLYFGYKGIEALGVFLERSFAVESLIQSAAVIGIGVLLVFAYFKRKKFLQ